jgi:hypothetical protein
MENLIYFINSNAKNILLLYKKANNNGIILYINLIYCYNIT